MKAAPFSCPAPSTARSAEPKFPSDAFPAGAFQVPSRVTPVGTVGCVLMRYFPACTCATPPPARAAASSAAWTAAVSSVFRVALGAELPDVGDERRGDGLSGGRLGGGLSRCRWRSGGGGGGGLGGAKALRRLLGRSGRG